MRILIDAMGGDNAPGEIVLGAIQAAKDFGVDITLVGRGQEILASMKQQGIDTLPAGMEIANADDVVDMHDDPSSVVKTRKTSSMIVGLKMLADGQADAMVSAGSSGALLTGATLLVKRIRGIRRAAFAPIMPNKTGKFLLLDAGANNECTPEFLMQFGFLGSCYAKKALNLENPRVGLLNNGTEETKGLELQREAYALLKKASDAGNINFVGNVEAREVPFGAADVVVCDGFSGNIFLKTMEGTALLMSGYIKQIFKRNRRTKLGYLLCKSGVDELKMRMDYRETGGTIILGITKPVVKAHGSSDARAIRSAIRQAKESVEFQVCQEIQNSAAQMTMPRE